MRKITLPYDLFISNNYKTFNNILNEVSKMDIQERFSIYLNMAGVESLYDEDLSRSETIRVLRSIVKELLFNTIKGKTFLDETDFDLDSDTDSD